MKKTLMVQRSGWVCRYGFIECNIFCVSASFAALPKFHWNVWKKTDGLDEEKITNNTEEMKEKSTLINLELGH